MQTKHLCVWSTSELRVRLARRETGKPSSKIFLLAVPRRYFFCGSFVLCISCVCHAFASVYCCLVVTWRERADLLALVCDVNCDFVTFPFGILGQVWYLIVLISDPWCLSYFVFGPCFFMYYLIVSSSFVTSRWGWGSLFSHPRSGFLMFLPVWNL